MAHSDTASLHLFLSRLMARSVLDKEEQDAILALPTRRFELKKGHDFVHINERVTYSSVIASGMVGRFGQTKEGARQFTAFHIPGDMVDLHSAVRPVGIGGLNALSHAVILQVPHSAIKAVAARYPAVAEAFWRDCMLDAAVLMQWVVNVGRRNARTRLAHLFCEMAVRYGQDREAVLTYDLPVTQEGLGDATALTSVHINRTLQVLKDVVTLKNGRVSIKDWATLERTGDFDPTYLMADVGPELQTRRLATG